MKVRALRAMSRSVITYVFILALIFGVIGLFAARNNNLMMIELRNKVVVADQGNGDVEAALAELREYIYGHMNTNLTAGSNAIKPPIQLKGRYDRLMAQEAETVKQKNAEVAAAGERLCAAKFPASGFNAPRVACVQDYVAANAVKDVGVAESLYKFDFVSPKWTPDLAGLSLLASAVLFLVGCLLIGYKLIKRSLL